MGLIFCGELGFYGGKNVLFCPDVGFAMIGWGLRGDACEWVGWCDVLGVDFCGLLLVVLALEYFLISGHIYFEYLL
jgi:hypothetical protein